MPKFSLLPMENEQPVEPKNSTGRFSLLPVEKEERSLAGQGARIAGQFGLGLLEKETLPYDLAVAPLAQPEAQLIEYRKNIMEDIERLSEEKAMGVWDEQDEALLNNLVEQIKNPELSKQFVKTADVSTRGLIEKATGISTAPENMAESVANLAGFIKHPEKAAETFGLNPKNLIKSFLPTFGDVTTATGIELGLKMAEDNDFGPIGKMGAMVAGDIAARGAVGALKGGKRLIQDPKKFIAETVASFSNSEKKALQSEMIESFRESGLQADLGSITDNNLIKMMQARMAASGLTGKKLDTFKKDLISEIKESYRTIANEIGDIKFQSHYEAGLATKEMIESLRKKDLDLARDMYKYAEESLGKESIVYANGVRNSINNLESKLKPGSLKSEGQRKVLSIVEDVKRDVLTPEGRLKATDVKNLINNKIALNDIIDYEAQGGTKQLLKDLVKELDRAIVSHGKENPRFANAYVAANKRFSSHAKTFRNKEANKLLREQDPTKILNTMNSVDGIKKIENILNQSKEGKDLFKNLKRHKLEDLFANSAVNSVDNQVKMGTFANAFSKGKDKEIAKEILGKKGYERLQRLQKNVGALNETAQKFFNASQSGTSVIDTAIVGKYLMDMSHLLYGNPWPLARTAGAHSFVSGLTSLITDQHFLKLVEDAIIVGKSNSTKSLIESGKKLLPYFKFLEEENKKQNQKSEKI